MVITYMSYRRRLIAILVLAVMPVLVSCIAQVEFKANSEFIILGLEGIGILFANKVRDTNRN